MATPDPIRDPILERALPSSPETERAILGAIILDNTLISPTDFSTYCVTAPTDPRLPASISGQQICGLYDLNPDKFGQNRSIVTSEFEAPAAK